MSKIMDKDTFAYFWNNKLKPILNGKVNKVEGKGLSSNDFTNADKVKIEACESSINMLTSSKVDKVTGKALSTHDFTTERMNKLSELAGLVTELGNNKVDKIDGKDLSANDFTTERMNKIGELEGLVTGLGNNKVDKIDGKALSANDFTNENVQRLNEMWGSPKLRYVNGNGAYDENGAYLQVFDKVLSRWQWINPPMEYETEYETAERYKANVVYVKIKSLGDLPNNTTKNIVLETTPFYHEAWWQFKDYTTNSINMIPSSNPSWKIDLYRHGQNVHVTTYKSYVSSDGSAYQAYMLIKYIK